MGLISARYNPKILLLSGLDIYALSAMTGLLSPTLYIMLPLFALTGVARAMVEPMVNFLIGIHVPADRRTSAIGYTVAGLALVYALGSLSTAYLSSYVDWRVILLLIIAPITVLNIMLAVFLIPPSKIEVKETSMNSLFSGYTLGLRSSSVLACLAATFLGFTTWNAYLLYGVTFIRKTFGLSAAFASQVSILYSSSYIIGSLLTGRSAKKVGRKTVSVGTMALLAFFSVFGWSLADLVQVIVFTILSSFMAGMMLAAMLSLTLDQLPLHRGTVMSLQYVTTSLGAMVAAFIGGIMIASTGFGAYGYLMAVFGFSGTAVLYLFSKDPK